MKTGAEQQPKVSVVIPAYNAEKTLGRMLDSLSAQGWDNLEIIVTDDGSTDGTAALVERRAETNPGIRLIRKEKGGVSAARNAALALCTGKYIRFADADDTVPPDSLRQMVTRAERDGSELVIGGYTQYIGDRHTRHNLADRGDTVPCDEILDHLCAHANSYFYGVLWNKLFLRETVEQAGARFQEDLFWGEDFAFVTDCLGRVKTVSFMKEALYDYRRSADSASVRQVLDCVAHPAENIRIKRELYGHLKRMYQARGRYEEYRKKLWLYLFRVGLG